LNYAKQEETIRKGKVIMKRILSCSLCLCLMLVMLAGCGNSAATPTPAATPSPAATSSPQVNFPVKTIRLICPYGAGGGTDTNLRALAEAAQKFTDVNIVVENVTGGTGITGITTMMATEPDGYSLCSVSGEWISLATLGLAPADFDYQNCERVMHYCFTPQSIIVAADSPYQTIEDLIEGAKTNAGGIILATTGSGSSQHLTTLLLEKTTETDFNIIPYSEGGAAVVAALIGGHADVICVEPGEASAQVDAGTARYLAVASDERITQYPDVPTLKESGIDIVYGAWRGLAVPKGTPAEVIAVLEDIFVQAAQDPDFVSFMEKNVYGMKVLNAAEWEPLFESQETLIQSACEIYLDASK